jgi:DNA topoisomerase II
VLILTEGDSAKSLAMSGIQVVGRDKYGVFPLKGKLLNVREAGMNQLKNNQEIQDIIKILGLKIGQVYTDVNSLRYGSIMIMADQDHDGSHIKGLVINFIHHFWPSLIKLKNFMKEFITPIIKVRKGDQCQSFFTMGEYEQWCKNTKDISKYSIKYYKGLGTSTSKEAKEYFKNINVHKIDFHYSGQKDDDAIELAFSKKLAEKRKEWLADSNRQDYVDHSKKTLNYNDFVHKELVHFSIQDCNRAIPSVMDGLKPSQRKILYSCFKRNLTKEIKVAQLAGYVSEHSAYHHGEASLCQTIINMAQNFVGSKNINLLMPLGQFGSRHLGIKEAASPRYIYTCLNKITRSLFKEQDDPILEYLEEEGMKIEPKFYAPIIPLILVNGAEGIGTGWATKIPCYNPLQIVENIKLHLDGKEMQNLNPWFKGYQGQVEVDKQNNPIVFRGATI